MTRPAGAPRKLYEKREHSEVEYSVQIAVIQDRDNATDFENGKQRTHDAAIAHAGDRRRSGVQWYIYNNDHPKLNVLLANIEEAEDRPMLEVREHLRKWPHSCLVIAMCEVGTE